MAGLLNKGTSNVQNTIALVRYFELSISIALISEDAFEVISKQAINQVLDNFFSFDALTQMALMDFFVQFDQMPWTGNLTAPFLAKLFSNFRNDQDVYGLVKSNLVVLAASVYGRDPTKLNVFDNEDFLWFLTKFCNSSSDADKQAACSCLFFLFQ